eukprot:TCONS_00026691-protein
MAAGRDHFHWTEELFLPKFTSDDLFFKDLTDEKEPCKTKIANDFYTQIYLKVIAEEKQQQEAEERKRNLKQYKNSTHKNVVVVDIDSSESSIDEDFKATLADNIRTEGCTSANKRRGEICEGKELYILRKAYKELRERSLWLICVLENRNVKIEDLKSRVKKTEHQKCFMGKEISSLKKEILKLQAEKNVLVTNNEELDKKLEFYEDCNNGLKDAINKLQEEINQIKKSNRKKEEYFHKYQREKDTEISTLNKSKKDLLKSLPKNYEIQIERLQRNVEELEKELLSKREECTLHLSSLKSLEKHFSEFQGDKQTSALTAKIAKQNFEEMFSQSGTSLNRERVEATTNNFLNVTDI